MGRCDRAIVPIASGRFVVLWVVGHFARIPSSVPGGYKAQPVGCGKFGWVTSKSALARALARHAASYRTVADGHRVVRPDRFVRDRRVPTVLNSPMARAMAALAGG